MSNLPKNKTSLPPPNNRILHPNNRMSPKIKVKLTYKRSILSCGVVCNKIISETYTVKLDRNKFPYVIFNNKKIFLNNPVESYYTKWIYGLYPVRIEFISNFDTFKSILENPNLTTDKINGIPKFG